MTITSVDGILAGAQPSRQFYKALTGTMVAGRPHSLFYTAGIPGNAVAPAPGIGGAVLTTYSGQIPFTNPAGGLNTYLSRFQAQTTIAGTILLVDRLWHNSGIDVTSTAEQTFTSSAQIPARDANGTTTGNGVFAGLEVVTALGAGTPTISFKYTNQAGTAGQVGANTVSTVASSIAGSFYPIGLAAGDLGVQKAQSITLSATMTSGTVSLVLYRVLARLPLAAQIGNEMDALSSGFPRLFDNTVPFLIFIPNTTTTSNISGEIAWTQG